MTTKLGYKVLKKPQLVGMDCSAGKICCGVALGMVLLCGMIGVMVYFVSDDTNIIDQGPRDDLSIVQKSSGIHLL